MSDPIFTPPIANPTPQQAPTVPYDFGTALPGEFVYSPSPFGPIPPPPTPNPTRRITITPSTPAVQIYEAVVAGTIVEGARLIVSTAFDGSPTFSFGTPGNHGLFLATSDNILGLVGEYVAEEGQLFFAADMLIGFFTLGGATSGEATLLYEVR